jgi:hypothetical protein
VCLSLIRVGKETMSSIIEKRELFNCHVMLVNRGRVKFYGGGKYGTLTGSVRFFKWKRFSFTIPKGVIPLEFDKSKFLRKNRTMPLFIVNDLTKVAIGVSLREEIDPEMDTKINLLIERSFWEAFVEGLKLGLGQTIIYMLSGYGLFRFIEYLVSNVFHWF